MFCSPHGGAVPWACWRTPSSPRWRRRSERLTLAGSGSPPAWTACWSWPCGAGCSPPSWDNKKIKSSGLAVETRVSGPKPGYLATAGAGVFGYCRSREFGYCRSRGIWLLPEPELSLWPGSSFNFSLIIRTLKGKNNYIKYNVFITWR